MAEPGNVAGPGWIVIGPTRVEPLPPSNRGGGKKLSKPDGTTQADRRGPGWGRLNDAIEAERIRVETTVGAEDPELVIVVEVADAVSDFLDRVEDIDGIEFLHEASDERAADDEFHQLRRERDGTYSRTSADTLATSVYFVMTDAQAVQELLRLWKRFRENPSTPLPRPWKDIFAQQVDDVRPWSPQDRLTASLHHAVDQADMEGLTRMSVEVELWYRRDPAMRVGARAAIDTLVAAAGGTITDEAVIEGIAYHAVLVELPTAHVRDFSRTANFDSLVAAKQVMYLHRTTQASIVRLESDGRSPSVTIDAPAPEGDPLVALLDGLPLSNHELLVNRLRIDDPDGREAIYPAADRCHATAMASVIIHGDLSAPRDAHARQLYVRPILEPADRPGQPERYPTGQLVCDLLHRSVVRMCEGDAEQPPAAPSVRIVNLSIGDPERQLGERVSPLARLVDYLSVTYNLLFVVAAGNHSQPIDVPSTSTDVGREIRRAVIGQQLDRRLLSPAEAINAITVGALDQDRSDARPPTERIVDTGNQGLPAFYSATGRGFLRSVKPEVFAPGGRQFYRAGAATSENDPTRRLHPLNNVSMGPGILVAQSTLR